MCLQRFQEKIKDKLINFIMQISKIIGNNKIVTLLLFSNELHICQQSRLVYKIQKGLQFS